MAASCIIGFTPVPNLTSCPFLMLYLVEATIGDRLFQGLRSRQAQLAQGAPILPDGVPRFVRSSCLQRHQQDKCIAHRTVSTLALTRNPCSTHTSLSASTYGDASAAAGCTVYRCSSETSCARCPDTDLFVTRLNANFVTRTCL